MKINQDKSQHTLTGSLLKNSCSNLKVVDASTVLAGPSVGTFFAELGAEVIKIEHPKHSDVTRSWKLPSENKDSKISAYFSSINYKKKYRFLDLKSEDDKQSFLKEIESADILLMNFKMGDQEKFGLSDAILQETNPKLIIGKINGYGNESDRVAYDLILQAESGFMSINGTSESGPVKMPVALIDVLASHHLKEALLLALWQREKTNQGTSISVSLYESAVSSLVNQASNYLMGGKVPQRIGSLHPNIAPYGEIFETKNGDLVTFAIGSHQHFVKLCSVLELSDLPVDEKFSENQNRVKNRTELAEILKEKILDWNPQDLLSELRKLNVPAGKITSIDEVFQTELAQSMIREEEIDGVSTKRVTSVVFKEKNGN